MVSERVWASLHHGGPRDPGIWKSLYFERRGIEVAPFERTIDLETVVEAEQSILKLLLYSKGRATVSDEEQSLLMQKI
jgi:hypothetical protein